ncbi:MAG: HAD family phosphatase [Oscillospiraceae bacterium]|nr:HAD family phosphatase [Oscillospiraceae bacterium]
MRIKLIVSDIDGTLIPYGEAGLPEALFPLVRALRASGVLFCPASGRQYHSLRRLFAPVADEIAYLCENGAVVMGAGPEAEAKLLFKTPMPRAGALALMRAILALPGCEVLVSGENVSYLCPKDAGFIAAFREMTGNHIRVVERVEDVAEDVVKVSAYAPEGLDAPKAALGPRFGGMFRMAEAGPAWLDFTLADKGAGLRGLCGALGVPPDETAAFGDNWNDVAMLETAGVSYLMSTASPELRQRFPRQCDDVLAVLERILAEQ